MTQDERAPEPSAVPEADSPATQPPEHDPQPRPRSAVPDVPATVAVPEPVKEPPALEPGPQTAHKPAPKKRVSSKERPAAETTPVEAPSAGAASATPEEKPAGAAQAEGEGPPLAGRGEIVEATVRRLAPFGAFVRLADGRKGLIHISQVAEQFVEDIKQHLEVGQTVRARITAVLEDGKVDLSIKKAKPRPKPERPPRPKRRERSERDRAESKPPKPPEQFHVNPLADALADVEKRLSGTPKKG